MNIENHIANTDWGDLFPRLVLYAHSRLNRLTWRGRYSGHIPNGMEAHDFVSNALLKTLSGERAWDANNKPLANHMMDVIKSDVSNLVNSYENLFTSILSEIELFHLSGLWDTELEVTKSKLASDYFSFVKQRNPNIYYTAISMYRFGETNPINIAKKYGKSVAEVKRDRNRVFRATEAYRTHIMSFIRDEVPAANKDREAE